MNNTMSSITSKQARASLAPVALGNCQPESSWPALDITAALKCLELVNTYRISKGLSSLSIRSSLASAAGWKARHMAEYEYMAHDDPAPPVSRSTGDRISTCGYTDGMWAENIAYGYTTPESVMAGWLNSVGHRANLEGNYSAIGIGVAGRAWCQVFGIIGTEPPPLPTINRAEILAKARAHMAKTTITYATWLRRRNSGYYTNLSATEWAKVEAELDKLK